jgi:hypothetical protein
MRWRGGFLGKAVVDSEGATDYEQAIGYVVSGAESEFLDAGIDEKRTHFQSDRLIVAHAGAGLGGPLNCGPFTESDDVRFGDSCDSARVNGQD